MQDIFNWVINNYVELFGVLGLFLALAEGVVRLTPTKADDGAVERIGKLIRQIMDLLRIPNMKKKQ